MKLTAHEARELMPRGYIPTDEIMKKIKVIAEAGLNYFWTDLTQGQIKEFEDLGYKIERDRFRTDGKCLFKIEWK